MYRLSCLCLWLFSSASPRGMLSSSISLMASLMSDASSFIQSSGISSFCSMRKLCKITHVLITSRMEDKSCFWVDCFIIIGILCNQGNLPFHIPIACSDSTYGFNKAMLNISCSCGMADPCGFSYALTMKGQHS